MKHLQLLNLALAALAATFAIVLAVVCILYAANLDAAPQLHRELFRLLAATALFALFSGFAAWVWWAHHARKSWSWWSQAAMAPVLAATALALTRLVGIQ